MRTLRWMVCAAAMLMMSAPSWAQQAGEKKAAKQGNEEMQALRAQQKEITKKLDKLRRKLRKNEEIKALYQEMAALRKKIDAKYAELDPEYGKLLQQREEIREKMKSLRRSRGRKRGRKAKGKKGGE